MTTHRQPVASAADITLYLSPQTLGLAPGQTGTLALNTMGAQNLAGFETVIDYDPALLRIDDIQVGDWLSSTGRTVGALGPQIDNVEGTARVGAFSFGSAQGVNGDGTLALLTVTALAAGDGAMDLRESQATDPDASPMTVTEMDGAVEVRYGVFLPWIEK